MSRFQVGDEVYGMPYFPRQAGAYAEFVAAPSRQLARKPAGLSHAEAAALPLVGLTARQSLVDIANVQAGQRVLIHGAGGGLGHPRAVLGFFWASWLNQGMPTKSPVEDEVVTAVTRLLRQGLPVTPASADAVLLELRGVVARAVDPADPASRTTALDGTLRGLLARFPDARYAPAVRALFGLPPAGPGLNLTTRRDLAAEQAGHEVHHFRKRVEPKLIERIAWELLADADRFTRMPMIAPRLAPVTDRQPVPADPFAWEVTEHEEQLTRLWSALYAARADLLAVERLVSLRADRIDLIRAAVTAAWRWAVARAEAIGYTTAYAPDSETSVDDLLALAGWTPELTEAQASRLTEAADGGASREQFVHALHNETGLGNTWVDGLLGPGPLPTTIDENGPTQ